MPTEPTPERCASEAPGPLGQGLVCGKLTGHDGPHANGIFNWAAKPSEEIPAAAVQAVAERMLRRYESEYQADQLTWRDFADEARGDLVAALPYLWGGRRG